MTQKQIKRTADNSNLESNSDSTMKKPSRLGFFVLLSTYYKKYLFRWIGLIIFTIVTAGITIALPKLTNIIMSDLARGIAEHHQPPLADMIVIYWAIGFGASFIVQGIFLYLQSLIGGSIARKIEIDIRIRVLNKLVDLDMNYYHDKKMGDILTKLISDTQILGDQSYQVPQNFLNAFFVFLGSIIIMFTLDNPTVGTSGAGNGAVAELAGIILGVSFAILLLTTFGFTFIRRLMLKQRKVVSNINGDVNDRINAIRLIKSSGTASYEKKRFVDIHKEYYTVSMQAIRTQSLIIAFVITTLTSMNTISLIVGIIFINQGKLNPTVLLSVSMSINSLIMPIIQVVRLLANLATASTSSMRVTEIFQAKAKVNENLNGEKITGISGNIIFKNVSFKYDVEDKKEPLILKDFNFTFEQGKSYAVVGETGVGKSTIARLLLRYYDPTEGTIYVNNNRDLSKINLSSYLTHLGYVEQEPQVLYGTFYDNIRYASFDATDEEIEEAAKKAELYEFVQQLPNKFNTILGERGFILSGGQKQRLVIARMFLRNPDILILDEATSSLDNIVEKEIQEELDLLMKNRTSIVIAHRLSTIRNVDQILVLEKDKGVVQIGSFNELKTKDGRFKKLYEAGLMD